MLTAGHASYSLKQTVAANSRHFTYKYWVLLVVWEIAAVSIAYASWAGGSTPLDGSFIRSTLFFVLCPVLPLVVPMNVQYKIGTIVSTAFSVLFLGGILFAAGGYVAVWFAPDKRWAYEWRYSLEKDMKGAVVTVERKPHDCDFTTAPLGAKHCHYERQLNTVRVRMKAGQRMVSYDEGRTWAPDDGSSQPAVWVTWHRVDD
jgi:predicted membrane channel-forming protein YqfA (hemolysin III family)